MVHLTTVTSHRKTYTNAFPLNGLNRWQSIGYLLGTHWVPVGSGGKSVGSVGKAVEKPDGKVHASHSRC